MTKSNIERDLIEHGYALRPGPFVRDLLVQTGMLADWEAFAASWDDLAPDTYMADGGRYRRRRHARASASPAGVIKRLEHGPHFQGLDYNALNGGIERWFEPIDTAVFDGPSMTTILNASVSLFQAVSPHRNWFIELHQFRIEARSDEAGQPTPEGAHRDGVDYVLVLMVRRENIARGVTTIAGPDGTSLGTFTLAAPFDAAIIDDHRVYHGVTPVTPVDPTKPAFRDVLVVTFRARPTSAPSP